MNYKDFEIARKKRKTELAHKAIIRKMAEKRLSRPRIEVCYIKYISNKKVINFCL